MNGRSTQPAHAPLKYKSDWPEATKRLTATWQRSNDDRPALDIRVRTREPRWPARPDGNLERLYLDPQYVLEHWLAQLDSTAFLAEAVPTGGHFMGGYALGCGEGVTFAPDTVWQPHRIDSVRDEIRWESGEGDPWRRKLDAVVQRLMRESTGKFLVGTAEQMPLNDLLPLLRGTQEFLLELADDPEAWRSRLLEVWPRWHDLFLHYLGLSLGQGHGCVWGWPGIWHPTELVQAQSDMSCMISSALFERYALCDLDLLGERHDFVWYHLDGWDAVRHLGALLGRPYIQAIQYVSAAGQPPNGPTFLGLYRQVQAGGRCLDLEVPWENVPVLIRRLRPRGLILRTWAPSIEAAQELLARAPAWAASECTQ
jgi:hypothetical protein